MTGFFEKIIQFNADYQYWLYLGFAVLVIGALLLSRVVGSFKFHLHGGARFADSDEVKSANLYGDDGMVLGMYKGRVLRLAADSHCALVAPTRGGKDVAIVVPTLTTWKDSLVANDKKKELGEQTSEMRKRYGQLVWHWRPYSTTTHRYNPLDYVSMDPMEFVASIQSIAYILYPAQYQGETMWSNNSRALFVYLVMLVKESDDMPSTLGEVFRITGGYGDTVPNYLQKKIWKRNYDRVEHLDDNGEVVSIEYVKKPPYDGKGVPHLSQTCVDGLLSFVTAPKDTGGGILANTRAALQIWASEIVDAATSESDFDLRTLRQVRQSIYLHIPPNKTKQGGVLLTMFYTQLVNANMDELAGKKYPHKILLALDEFGSLHLPIIEETIGEMAGYGMFCLLVMQNKGQLEKPSYEGGYGIAGAKNLLGNCMATVFFTPEYEDSKEISDMLGTRTVKVKSKQLGKPMQGSVTDQRRELMMAQELREMPQTKQIVKVKNCRHIMCDKIIWYKRRAFLKRFWAISKKLDGVMSPTKPQIEDAVDELCSFIPTLDTKAWLAGKRARELSMEAAEIPVTKVVPATHLDIVNGLKLNDVVVGDHEFEEGTSTEDQIKGYLDAFFETDSDDTETIDTETGEVLATTVDITGILDVA